LRGGFHLLSLMIEEKGRLVYSPIQRLGTIPSMIGGLDERGGGVLISCAISRFYCTFAKWEVTVCQTSTRVIIEWVFGMLLSSHLLTRLQFSVGCHVTE
jgi:hypothetical protein